MNIASIDLNLLVAFRALAEHGSVSVAARRLGKSQPAISNALGRLRQALSDPLFVRGGRGIVLTPRGAELLPAVNDALARLEHALAPGTPFDPSVSEHAFTLAATDYAQMVFLPPLMAALGQRAPRLLLHVRPAGEVELTAGLSRGVLDGALGMFPRLGGALLRKKLLRERFVCLVRRGHPAARGKLTLAKFQKLSHLQVAPLGVGLSSFDELLARHGVSRRITLRVPSFLVAPLVVAESDLVVTLPERVARAFARRFALEILAPPVEPPVFDVLSVWHERTAASPPHRFLRALVAELAAGV